MSRWTRAAGILQTAIRTRSVVIAAATYLLVALACTQIPLVNTLGYEFSFIVALVGSIVSGFLTISLIKPVYHTFGVRTPSPDPPGASLTAQGPAHHSIVPSFLSVSFIHLILLLLPPIIILVNGFFVRWCSIPEGLAFYALLPVVSVWFSSTLALFCTLHYRYSRWVFVLIVAGLILYAGLLGYFTPAIFSYNFFYGFFPGLSYDELLTIRWPLILFRAITILLGVVLLWFSTILVRHTRPLDSTWQKGLTLARTLLRGRNAVVTGALAILILGLYIFRCDLGFESTASFIQQRLGGVIRTEHCTIYYSPASYSEEEVRCVAANHEFQFQDILSTLYLPHQGKIESYIYPTAASKQRFIGTGTTNIAKPWNREIHLTKQSVDQTLRHEMVHVLAGRFGAPVIHASTSTGLVEGIAMAVEDQAGNRTLHQYAAAMRCFGVAPDIRRLMTPIGFMSQASSVSYVLAGSLCRYLIDRHGIRPLLQVYRNGDYENAFGYSLDTLVVRWQQSLDSVVVAAQDSGRIDVFFRGRPIFGKICPRVIARRVRDADRLFGQREYARAYRAYDETYAEGHGNESLRGMMASLFRLRDYSRVTALLDSVSHADQHPLRYLTLYLLGGDAAWAVGDTLRARRLYAAVRDADITEGYTEAARVRIQMLSTARMRDSLLKYLLLDGPDDDRVVLMRELTGITEDTVLCRYLLGRIYTRMGEHEQAAEFLASVSWERRDPWLEGFRLRNLAAEMEWTGKCEDAKRLYWNSLNGETNEQTTRDVNEAIDRCEWRLSKGQ